MMVWMRSCSWKLPLVWYLSLLVSAASVITIIAAILLEPSTSQCMRHDYSWSPAASDIQYKWQTFENIDFFTKSPFFSVIPSLTVDNAWNDILPRHPIGIPKAKLQDLSQSVDVDWAHAPGDSNTILAISEYVAQLGCLNFIRQWSYFPRVDNLYYDYSYLASFQGGEEVVLERTHQCLERLRQAVMCWADSGVVIKYAEVTEDLRERWILDFGTYHNCRDFDKLQAWTHNNAITSVSMQNLWWSGDRDVICEEFGICV
ncbi:hypothetical protein F5Y18DRAFT_389778 [Xylariaceae sp. FL1019]|nr:hypothetical protein F5Y18DRAFT_389778 [Xylariaceae sp. FL1019]